MSSEHIEKFNSDSIDKMCSFTGEELYELLYDDPNHIDFKELNDKKWNKADCIKHLEQTITFCQKVTENGYIHHAKYKKARTSPEFGRDFVIKFGIQRLPKLIRGFLTGADYIDVDIKNCHPVLLLKLFHKENIPIPPMLQDYCENREKVLHDNKVTKLDIIKIINTDKLYRNSSNYLQAFHTELIDFKVHMFNKYPELKTNNKRQPHSSLVNKLLCKEEAIVLDMVLNELNIKNSVKMFDGFMFRPCEHEALGPISDIIERLNTLTAEWNINWTVKEPTTFLFPADHAITPWVKPVPRCLINLTEEGNVCFKTYTQVKTEFEKDNFIIKHPLTFCSLLINAEGEEVISRADKSKFFNTFQPLFYEKTSTDDEGKITVVPHKFMPKWFDDPDRREYTCADFLPPPLVCPVDTYNLYGGMRWETLEKDGVIPDDDIEVFLHHLRVLSGSDQTDAVYAYLLNYFAHVIQRPGEIPGTGIVLNSPQGYGKNLFVDNFGRQLLGYKYHLSTANADRFAGRWRDVMGKFFGIYNEASSKDTFGLEGKIKELITEPRLDWEKKGQDPIEVRSFIRIITLSNKDNPIQLGQKDRRWQVIEITGEPETKLYFQTLFNAFQNDAKVLGLVNYLKKIDLSNWDPQRDRVETLYYKSMKSINVVPRERFLAAFTLEREDGISFLSPTEFYDAYTKWMNKLGYKAESSTMFGLKMKNHEVWGKAIEFKKSNYRRYYFNRELLIAKLIDRGALNIDDIEEEEVVTEECVLGVEINE